MTAPATLTELGTLYVATIRHAKGSPEKTLLHYRNMAGRTNAEIAETTGIAVSDVVLLIGPEPAEFAGVAGSSECRRAMQEANRCQYRAQRAEDEVRLLRTQLGVLERRLAKYESPQRK